MYLHNDKELFEEVVYGASQALHIPVSIVEKDYLNILKGIIDFCVSR